MLMFDSEYDTATFAQSIGFAVVQGNIKKPAVAVADDIILERFKNYRQASSVRLLDFLRGKLRRRDVMIDGIKIG